MGQTILSRVAWASVALLGIVLLRSLLLVSIGRTPTVVVAGLLVFAAVHPVAALLTFIAAIPIADTVFLALRNGPDQVRFGEALTLAVIAGWAVRHAVRSQHLTIDARVLSCSVGLLAAAASSTVVNLVRITSEHPEHMLLETLDQVSRDYLRHVDLFSASLLFVEGLILVLVAADVCSGRQRRDAMLRMIVVGSSAAALVNVLRLVVAAVAQEHTLSTLIGYLSSVRVAINFGDLNAAGSYFAMTLFIAIALAWRAPRVFAFGAILTAAGLWISGSRIALVAALMAAAFTGLIAVTAQRAQWKKASAALLAAVAAIALAGWYWYPEGRNVNTAYAFSFRMEMARAALALTRTEPWFGVGLGRFYALSAQYASVPENAHNNFLQVMTELGVPALVLFVVLISLALNIEWQRVRTSPKAWGLITGLAAFLLTCLGGHPLLVPSSSYAFWTALGIACVPTDSAQAVSAWLRRTVIVCVLLYVVTLPFRVGAAARDAELENATIGLSRPWEHDPSGLRYRWAGARSAFFVPAAALRFAVPLRAPTTGPPIVEVRIALDGREADRVLLRAGEDWRIVRLLLPRRAGTKFFRVDIEAKVPNSPGLLDVPASNTGGALMVGRPELDR